VVSICIDPNDGGATHIMGLMRTMPRIPRDPYAMPTYAQMFWSTSAVATLAAGYVGSSIVGFLLVVSGSDMCMLSDWRCHIVLLLFVPLIPFSRDHPLTHTQFTS
jgi:hypothetical protein